MRSHSEPIRVLHVDDDPDFGEMVAEFLERADDRFAVETVTGAAEGLDRLAETRVDCVVSDYDMPERTGIEFLAAVREDRPELPFVLFTGKGSEEVASEAISAGVTDYFEKGAGTDQYELLANRIENAVAQHRAQRRAAETNRRYSALFEHTTDAIAWIDFDGTTPVVRDANARFEELFAPGDGSVLGRDLDEVVTAGDRYEDARSISRRVRDGESISLTLTRETVDGERDFRCRAVPVVDPETDEVEYGFAVYSDITDDPDARKLERHRFSATFEAIPDPVAHVRFEDGRPIVETINAAFTETFGYGPTEIEGRSINDAIVPADRLDEAQAIDETRRTDDEIEREVVRETADGRRTFLLRAKRFDSPTGERESIAVYTDITDRKERERELRAERDRLDEFASVVSHDLRNPLMVAQGRVEMLREECDSDHLDHVERAHDRMESMIDDLLTLAREGAERVEDPGPVDLGDVTETCWRNTETADASLAVDDPPSVRADPSRLKQLLENLFRNAAEHGSTDDPSRGSDATAERGGRAVTVTVGPVDGDEGIEGFYVADDGRGIPSEERERVFEAGHSTAADGTGFGLNIVREVAGAHGWAVNLTDSEDGGARFEFTGVGVVE